jgi:hypothetical protein
MIILNEIINDVEVITIKSDHLTLSVVPSLGGKIIRLFNTRLNKEFLWTNKDLSLRTNQAGADYDANFIGGIDELLPNDIPETIDGILYPDHGELWTSNLQCETGIDNIHIYGLLPLSGLYYSRTVRLSNNSPVVSMHYKIRNDSGSRKHFLWKMHAALQISEGYKMVSNALHARVVDPLYSRFKDMDPFQWPFIDGVDASIIPVKDNTMDFLYLYDVPAPEMQMHGTDGSLFAYSYDNKVFPYQWYFASYGGFLDHYVAILEPCTSMPMSVNEAKDKGQCTVLEPGEELLTTVEIFAGKKKNSYE